MKSPFDLKLNPDYTRHRLRRSVLLYDGLPTYIDGTDGRVVSCQNMRDREIVTKVSDAKFDFSPIKLGYTLFKGALVYLSRMPIRQWQAGITRNCINKNMSEDSFIAIMTSQGVLNTHSGVFNSFEEARNGKGNCIINRSIATRQLANGDIMMMYRGHNAGYVEDDRIVLSDRFSFLKETLEALDETVD